MTTIIRHKRNEVRLNVTLKDNATTFVIDRRNKYDVDMIGHHYRNVQVVSDAMIVDAAPEHELTSPFRHNPAIFRHKRNEVRLIVALKVRQVATIERHRGEW